MTNIYTPEELPQWEANLNRAMSEWAPLALRWLLQDIKIVPGRAKGGSPRKRQIPVDTGELSESLQIQIGTARIFKGKDSYVLAFESATSFDNITISWTADHAEIVHYGTPGNPGSFWIPIIALKWEGYLTRAWAELERKYRLN